MLRNSRICSIEYINGLLDHGLLLGLADDDHTQYLLADGSRDLTSDWTISTNNILLTDGSFRSTNGNFRTTNGDVIISNGDLRLKTGNTWTGAGVMDISDSLDVINTITVDSITIDASGIADTAGKLEITGEPSATTPGNTIALTASATSGIGLTAGHALMAGGAAASGVGGNVILQPGIGGVSNGNVLLAPANGNTIIGAADVTISNSGNFTNVGNINGSDVDISAGTGDYLSTGDVNIETLTVGDGGITDYFSVSATGGGQFFGAGCLLVGDDRYVFKAASDNNVGIFFESDGVNSEIEYKDTSGNVVWACNIVAATDHNFKLGYSFDTILNFSPSGTNSGVLHWWQDEDYFNIPNEIRFGAVTTNYSKFETDGTLEFNGTATVFEDIIISLDAAKVPAANAPTWSGFISNLNAYTYGVNDFQEFTSEIAHSYKEGSTILFHVHGATNGQEGSDKTIKFEIEYELIDNQTSGALGDVYAGTTTINAEITIPSGTTDKTSWVIDVGTDATGNFLQGAGIKGRVRRIASSGAEPAADPFVVQVGVHIEQDTVGSRTELTK